MSHGGSTSPEPGSDASDGDEPATGADTPDVDSSDDPRTEDDPSATDDVPSPDSGGTGTGSREPRPDDAAVGPTDSEPPIDPAPDASDGMTTPQNDASIDDPTPQAPGAPDSGSLSRGLGVDELAFALPRYWLVDAQIGGCGDLYRYEHFAAPPSFNRLVYSMPGCFSYPDGSSEYLGTYQLSGRRLTVVQSDIVLEERYDIAIEETVTGLVQYPGIYLKQSESAWARQAARERRDDEGALSWSIASWLTVDFGVALPLAEGEACAVSVNVELEFEGLEPEGDFLFEFGPYSCSVRRTAPDLVVLLPLPAAEELSMLDSLTSDTVAELWPTQLRLPRPNAEYLLPAVGYPEIAESDVHR